MDSARFELVLVGGGLQSGLIALGALHADPSRRIALVEAGPRPGGNHTWCLHPHDVPAAARQWVDPLVTYRWPRYDVRFPDRARTLDAAYSAITSERFATVVLDAFARSSASEVYLGCRATHIDAHEVVLDDGTTLRGDLVVDARGPRADAYPGACGFQKFLGLELLLARPHALRHPMLMDATVPQRDGYRFFYVLPFGPEHLLVEETYFSRGAALDPAAARASVLDYAARFGTVASVVREESRRAPHAVVERDRRPDRLSAGRGLSRWLVPPRHGLLRTDRAAAGVPPRHPRAARRVRRAACAALPRASLAGQLCRSC